MTSLDMTIFFNLGSLTLGLAALLLACAAVFVRLRRRSKNLTAGSFALCALSMLLQIAEINHRISINDSSAVFDTIGTVLFASAVLFILTAMLNAAALIRRRSSR